MSDTTDADFQRAVIDRSRQVPILVDFWAPWCGPCRTLGPLLDRMAMAHDGRFEVVKVNIDENPGVVEAFRIQSIPRLVGFRDGRVVVDQLGALPERDLRVLIGRLLPSAGEQLAGEGRVHQAAGDLDGAERSYRESLDLEPRCAPALIGLAGIEADRGEFDCALQRLALVVAEEHSAEAERLAARIRMRRDGGGDESSLRRRIVADPDDLASRLALGRALAAREAIEDALTEFLEIVRRDRHFDDGAARKAMLDLFEVLGPRHPLVDHYRGELAKVLFR